nr:molybdopterin dinucleotide binding domain-containing protein [Vibrio cincinnatiensis]
MQGHWWLNSGRQRDQWHTMTRTGHVAKLAAGEPEPTLYMNPLAAESLGLQAGEIAALRGEEQTSCLFAKVALDEGLKGKQLFMSMHWAGRYSEQSQVNRAIGQQRDPISGQPAFKSALVHLASAQMHSYGLYVGERRALPECDYQSYQQEQDCGVSRFASLMPLNKAQFAVNGGEQVLHWDLPQGWLMILGRSSTNDSAMRVTGIVLVSPQPIAQDYTMIATLIG